MPQPAKRPTPPDFITDLSEDFMAESTLTGRITNRIWVDLENGEGGMVGSIGDLDMMNLIYVPPDEEALHPRKLERRFLLGGVRVGGGGG